MSSATSSAVPAHSAPPAAVPAEQGSVGPARPARRSSRSRRREYLLFLAFVAPNFLLLGVFSYWPIVYNGYLSLTSWNMISPTAPFVGLANYVDLFTDPGFWRVLRNTGVFLVGVVGGSLVLGVGLALLLNQRLRGRGFVRTMVFAPHVLSGAAVGTIWLFLFDPEYGVIRSVLGLVGVTSPRWMTDSGWTMTALIIVYLWKGVGFTAIVYLAGLQSVPVEVHEAARLDGAGGWTLFRRITFPLLTPVTFFLLVTGIITTFQAFDVIAVMTGGGPGEATTILSWFIYEQGFAEFRAGYAAAGAMIMFFLLLAITAVQARYVERRVHYR